MNPDLLFYFIFTLDIVECRMKYHVFCTIESNEDEWEKVDATDAANSQSSTSSSKSTKNEKCEESKVSFI